MSTVHPTAIIDSSAKIGAGVSVGPYSVIGPDVEIGDNTWVGPHVVINGPTKIGAGNKIYQFASIGEAPQDLKYDGEPTRLEIGDRNTIREYATINRGTVSGGGLTKVGSDNLLMAYIHIAHDCRVGNHVIFSNNASLAGHVHVGDYVILSGFAIVHQFTAIGDYAFVGMGSSITKDVPPYLMISGNPASPHGLNKVGLKRRGFSEDQVRNLIRVYKLLYRQGLGLEEATAQIEAMAKTDEEVVRFSDFLKNSTRSIIR